MMQLLFVVVAQLLAPIGVIVWLFAGRPATRGVWLARVALGVGVVGLAAVAGVWIVPPWPTPYLYVALLAASAWVAWSRTASDEWLTLGQPLAALGMLLTVAVALGAWGLAAFAVWGWVRPNTDLVELSFPLREGTYYVANGGSNVLINPHMSEIASGPRMYRGQSYGIDIVGVGAFGLHADALLPADPRRYHIFGDEVFAPCAGEVVRAVDGLNDMPVPQMEPQNPAGNHVVVRCGPYDVMLAHLQLASVSVVVGDRVSPGGAPLGLVGNSGNSNEPHLHIHAQEHASGEDFMNARPVPMLFDGNYLVRNQRVRPHIGAH